MHVDINHHFHLMSVCSHLGWGWMSDDCFSHPSIMHHMYMACSSTLNKFISSITHSLHYFLGIIPSGCRPPTLTSPTSPNTPPSALFTCPNYLSHLCLNLTERSSTPHISATSLLDLLSFHLTPAKYTGILHSHLHKTSISLLSMLMFLLHK